MATEKVPIRAQAVIGMCTLCDRGVDARFFCTDCNEEMCKHCKTTHLRSRLGRDHNVISIADDKDMPPHDVEINCAVHKQENVQMFCNNCELLVCHTCISDKQHHSHDFHKIADVTRKYRLEISGQISNIKQKIRGMKSTLNSLEANKTDYIKDTYNVIDNIDNKREKWKSQADNTADSLIQQVQDYICQDLKFIDKQCKEMQDFISKQESLLRSYEETHKSGNADTIIKCAADIHKTEETNLVPEYVSSPRLVTEGLVDLTDVFQHLKVDKPPLKRKSDKEMNEKLSETGGTFGNFPTNGLAVVAEFPLKDMSRISAVGDRNAWVAACGRSIAQLVDTDGNVIKNIELGMKLFDIKATAKCELFITTESDHQIQKYNTDGKCVTIADMSPLKPRGLCITSDDDLLVCLGSRSDDNNKVIRMTVTGQLKQTIQYHQNKQPLYREPSSVTENINGDVCVVDGIYPSNLVVVNKDGVLRFKYPDTGKSANTIQYCSGIACDTLGYIYISIHTDHTIHQIDIEGRFKQYILAEQHGIEHPWGLDIDREGKLWICNENGNKVKVMKYRS